MSYLTLFCLRKKKVVMVLAKFPGSVESLKLVLLTRRGPAVWRCLNRGGRSFAGTFLGDARAWGLAC